MCESSTSAPCFQCVSAVFTLLPGYDVTFGVIYPDSDLVSAIPSELRSLLLHKALGPARIMTDHMSYSLNSLRGGYVGDYIGDYRAC